MNRILYTLVAIATCSVTTNALAYHVNQKQLLVLLNGTKKVYECSIPATDRGTVKASCHDHDVIDMKTNRIIGTATDATADADITGTGIVATGTTTFKLRHGTFVLRGRGSIQPVLEGTPVLAGNPVTHIAGIFPNDKDDNMILSGTGRYQRAAGRFTLLGALDLSRSDQGIQTFHCVYTIDLTL